MLEMMKKLVFNKCYLITRPHKYRVNGVTITVTPVYDGKQGSDIKKQFGKCLTNNLVDLDINHSGGTIT